MIDASQLPFLLKLVDDESEIAREGVTRALLDIGDDLPVALARLEPPPSRNQREAVQRLLIEHHRQKLVGDWLAYREAETEAGRLEMALAKIADFQTGLIYPEPLPLLLDRLADDCEARFPVPTVRQLARFLFEIREIRGAADDYYAPLNSNLVVAIHEKRGIPITLAAIYLLVGHRLGLDIRGCNFPGHFLAIARDDRDSLLVDCFNRGQLLDAETFARELGDVKVAYEEILKLETDAEGMIRRVLRNLLNAYQRADEPANRDTMIELLRQMNTPAPHSGEPGKFGTDSIAGTIAIDSEGVSGHIPPGEVVGALPGDVGGSAEPIFRVGQLVKHRKYGYRGIIVEFDRECQADDAWYWSNQTQPPREQPWYHVLVHNSSVVTYAAQSSLDADDTAEPISHPLVPMFFIEKAPGQYIRNKRPWPKP